MYVRRSELFGLPHHRVLHETIKLRCGWQTFVCNTNLERAVVTLNSTLFTIGMHILRTVLDTFPMVPP